MLLFAIGKNLSFVFDQGLSALQCGIVTTIGDGGFDILGDLASARRRMHIAFEKLIEIL